MSRGPISHPYQLLGITNERVGPFGLLGVSPERCTPELARRALQIQLARVNAHPLANSAEAETLRIELQAAADLLCDPATLRELRAEYERQMGLPPSRPSNSPAPAARPAAPPAIDISPSLPDRAKVAWPAANPVAAKTHPSAAPTPPRVAAPSGATSVTTAPRAPSRSGAAVALSPTERQLVMAIVSSGGWNARARRRAVAIASQRGLDVSTLVGSLVRIGSTPLVAGPASAGPGDTMAPAQPGGGEIAVAESGAVDPMRRVDPDSREVESERLAVRNLTAAAVTFIIGAVLTIPFGIFVLRELALMPQEQAQAVTSEGSGAGENDSAPGLAPTEDGGASGGAPIATNSAFTHPAAELQGLPAGMTDELESFSRAMSAAPELSDQLIARFDAIVGAVRDEWPRLDRASRAAVHSVIVSSIYDQATTPDDARAMLDVIDPPGGALRSKEDVWGWLWSKATLLTLAAESEAPSSAMRLVESRVRAALGGAPSRQGITFDDAADAALHALIDRLVISIGDAPDPVALWVAWSEAVSAVQAGADRDKTLLAGAHAIMAGGPGLDTSEMARACATAVFQSIDWRRSGEARRHALSWYDDARVASGDLSIFSAYLAEIGGPVGLDPSFILPADATAATRSRERDRLGSAWPVEGERSSRPEPSNRDVASWNAIANRALDEPAAATTDELLLQLVRLAQINEAAALLENDRPVEAQEILDNGLVRIAERVAAAKSSAANTNGAALASTPTGGAFATSYAYAEKLNDREGQLRLIQQLSIDSTGDLSTVDAVALAKLAIANGPRELRDAALDAFQNSFADGPNALLILADLIPPDRQDQRLSNAIERITGVRLPNVETAKWYAAARLALLRRVGELRHIDGGNGDIDALAAALADTYSERAAALDSAANGSTIVDGSATTSGAASVTPTVPPFDAARRCYLRWVDLASPMTPIAPIPAPLDQIERRAHARLAIDDDPIGAFAAWQLADLEVAAYVTAAERPNLRHALRQTLDKATMDRASALSVFEQLIATEKAILRVWQMRLGVHADGAGGEQA